MPEGLDRHKSPHSRFQWSMKTIGSVCLPCRKYVGNYYEGIKCSACAQPLRYIGAKLEAPKHSDLAGWGALAAKLDNPLYRQTWVEDNDAAAQRVQDARHWSRCRLRTRHGCEKCDGIKDRVKDDPDPGKLSWLVAT